MPPTHALRPPVTHPSPQRSTIGVSQVGLADEVRLDGVLVTVASGAHQAGRVVASEVSAILDAGLRVRDAGTWAAVAMGFNHAGPFVLESTAAAWVFLLTTFLVVCFLPAAFFVAFFRTVLDPGRRTLVCFLPVAFFVAFFSTVLDPGRRTLEGATTQDSLCCRGRPGLAHCTILRPRGIG